MAGGERTLPAMVIVSLPTTPAVLVPMMVISAKSPLTGTLTDHGFAAVKEPLAPALVCQRIVPTTERFVPPTVTEEVPGGRTTIWLVMVTTGAAFDQA